MKEKTINRIALSFALAIAVLGPSGVAQAQLANTPWPKQFSGLTNSSQGLGYGATGTILWSYSTQGYVPSSPTIGVDGTVYTGSDDGNLYAFDPLTGNVKWKFLTGAQVPGGATIAADGTLYVGSMDDYVYAIHCVTGTRKWSFKTNDIVTCTPTYANGTVYVGSNDGYFYAIDAATAKERFATKPAGMMSQYTVPAVASDGSVIYTTVDGYLIALNGQTGALEWKASGLVDPGTPTIGSDGTVYVAGTDVCYAYSATGALKWSYLAPSDGDGGICAIGSQYVYALTGETLAALNPADGAPVWTYNIGGDFGSCLSIAGDGTVYAGSSLGNLVALNGSSGAVEWSTNLGAALYGCPAIATDGTLFVGVFNPEGNNVVAIQSNQAVELNFAQSAILPGGSTTATITVPSPASQIATTFQLTSSSTDISVPKSVTIPAGQSSVGFPVTAGSSPAPLTATITAVDSHGRSVNGSVAVYNLKSITFSPVTIYGGAGSTGTLSLTGPAPADLTIDLTESSGNVQIPTTVSVAQGATQGTFTATAANVAVNVSDVITASLPGGAACQSTLYVSPSTLKSITFPASETLPGVTTTGTVTLNNPAPAGGVAVTLTSTSSSFTLPAHLTVPAGSSVATFDVTTPAASSPYTTTITAAASKGPSISAPLAVIAPVSLTFSPSLIAWSGTSTGTLTLSVPAPKALAVQLSSSNSQLQIPSTVTVEAGQTTATFTATATVTTATTAKVTASLKTASAVGVLSLTRAWLSPGNLVLTPDSVTVNQTISGSVKLNHPAPSGGLVLTISVRRRAPTVTTTFPPTITIPAGATKGSFSGSIPTTGGGTEVIVTAPDETTAYEHVTVK